MTKMLHFVPHFDCLDLRNAVLPLKMPLASHDTNNDAIDVM